VNKQSKDLQKWLVFKNLCVANNFDFIEIRMSPAVSFRLFSSLSFKPLTRMPLVQHIPLALSTLPGPPRDLAIPLFQRN
jgi:hypothetical protein